MTLSTNKMKTVQVILNNKLSHVNLKIDGDVGPATRAAILSVNAIPTGWPITRQLVGVIQWAANSYGIDAGPLDGYWGPQTEYAHGELVSFMASGIPPAYGRPEDGEGADRISSYWPIQTTSNLNSFYGPVGQNQVNLDLPYPMRIAWNTRQRVNRITCHSKVAIPVERILTNVKEHYGKKIPELGLDMFGGCLNVRKMRGGNSWSTHSWGIAFDFDPANNRLRWKNDKARFAKPVYDKWFQFWYDEGATSLGLERNYDWMHIQFASVKSL